MRTGKKILILLICGVVSALLSLLALKIIEFVGPTRNLLGFDLSTLAAIIVTIFGFFYGCVAAASGVFLKSFPVSLIISVLVSLFASWGAINDSVEIYRNPIYFDSELFISDLSQIFANFVIFPLICFCAYYAKTRFSRLEIRNG
jgi:hypothetical protein